MLHHLLWFLAGGWIGSLVTLVMVALLRKNSEAPTPLDEKPAAPEEAAKIRKTYDPA